MPKDTEYGGADAETQPDPHVRTSREQLRDMYRTDPEDKGDDE